MPLDYIPPSTDLLKQFRDGNEACFACRHPLSNHRWLMATKGPGMTHVIASHACTYEARIGYPCGCEYALDEIRDP